MTKQSEAVEIARGLTKAQRDKLMNEVYHGQKGWRVVYGSTTLARKGLLVGVSGPRLTALGLEVRNILTKEQSNGH
jgi:hypothetical protein